MASSLPLSKNQTLLITGINGYIAGVLGLHLLEKGYSLRGTARRAESTEALLEGPYAPYGDRVRIIEIPDMTVDGAFDEAVQGVDGIFHMASPLGPGQTTYEAYVIPAVKGVESILFSALKAGSQLKSVVVTSSSSAVVNPDKGPGYVFTEADYASIYLDKANQDKENGIMSSPNTLYSASKTASERAVWAFRDAHKPSFAITSINPCVTFGPPVVLVKDPKDFNVTLRPIYDIFAGASAPMPQNIGTTNFVDVRDVALMHTWAYENPSQADGERYLGASGFGPFQAVADIIRDYVKGTPNERRVIVGTPGGGYLGYDEATGKVGKVDFLPTGNPLSSKKTQEAMGLKFLPLNQTIVDTVKAFEPLLRFDSEA